MLYGKMPVILINSLAAEKNGSMNSQIARYILTHLAEVKDMGIQDIADGAYVSIASITRFVHAIGLESFSELKEILQEQDTGFEYIPADQYADKIMEGIRRAEASINMDQIDRLCRSIHDTENIHIYGLLKGQSAAVDLVSDLLLLGKAADTKTAWTDQMEAMKKMGPDELVILFSYTGSYFDYDVYTPRKSVYKAHMVMISGHDHPVRKIMDEFILFDSAGDSFSHPYTLEYIAGIIAQRYAALYNHFSKSENNAE